MSQVSKWWIGGLAILALGVVLSLNVTAEEEQPLAQEAAAQKPVTQKPATQQPAAETTNDAAAAEAPCCEDGECEKCEDGACEDGECEKTETAAATGEVKLSSVEGEAELATPTHRQSKIIKANQEGLDATQLNCFCMTTSGHILAGCGSSKDDGQVRVFNSEGEYVETWSSPVNVEAINVRASDGMVFVAGNGRIVKLSEDGNLVADEASPHATVSKEQAAKMREAVVEQLNERANLYKKQAEIYDQQIKLIGEKMETLQTKLDEMSGEEEAAEETADDDAAAEQEDADEAVATAEDDSADQRVREMLTQQLAQLERTHTALERTKELWNNRIEQMGDAEPSEEDIQRQIESQIARKLEVASISAVDDRVYVACAASVGYGYCVWSITDDLSEGEEIIGDLRGCCGQMDVQANAAGIYVAENSRSRVVRFDHQGEELTHWGHNAREGIRGFGSCCNPMNLAFGPGNTVYTAEDDTGRIKQYSEEGELLQVVGSADLVPGCKKVSIGVSHDGDRVFMLDITRDHIVMMDRIPTEERNEMVAAAKAKAEAAAGAGEKAEVDKQADTADKLTFQLD